MIFNLPKYVISLPERSDRRKDFILSAALAGIKDYRFFPALKGHTKKQAQQGCRLSHQAVIRLAREQNFPQVMIMEDDARFTPGILNKIPADLPEWDILYLGAHHHKPLKHITSGIGRCRYSLSTVCYIIKQHLYDPIIDLLEQDQILDMLYVSHLQPSFKCLCFTPNLVTQAAGYSDIELKVKDYSKFYGQLPV